MDTLSISKKLLTTGFSQEQAEVIATTIKQEVKARNEELATKSDMLLLQKDVKDLRWLMGAGFVVMGAGFVYVISLLNTIIITLG